MELAGSAGIPAGGHCLGRVIAHRKPGHRKPGRGMRIRPLRFWPGFRGIPGRPGAAARHGLVASGERGEESGQGAVRER